MTSQNEWSARRRSNYLNNKQKRQTALTSEGLEYAILATQWLQNYALDCMATGIDPLEYWPTVFKLIIFGDESSPRALKLFSFFLGGVF